MDISQSPRLKVDWLADGLFGPYANAFNRHLTLRRYAVPTRPRIRYCDSCKRYNYAQTMAASKGIFQCGRPGDGATCA